MKKYMARRLSNQNYESRPTIATIRSPAYFRKNDDSRSCTVAIGNPERHVRNASHRGSKQQQRSCAAISLTIACSRYIYNGVILHAHPVRGESHSQRSHQATAVEGKRAVANDKATVISTYFRASSSLRT